MPLMCQSTEYRSQREGLHRIEKERLYPSLGDPNYLVLRSRRIIFGNWIENFDGGNLAVLDVGGRYQPYRPLLEGRIARYIAADIKQTELVDVVCNGESLPFAADSFDVVIATQVLDYFSQPHQAAEQIHTVLKPGGILLMSVPSLAPRFAEEEKWRFTPAGIKSILSSFRNVEIIPETSSLGGLLRTANLGIYSFSYFHALRKIMQLTLCPALNLAGLAIEALKLTKNNQFTPNYSVRATK